MPNNLPLPGQENMERDISQIPPIAGAQEKARAALIPFFQGMQINPQPTKTALPAHPDSTSMLYESVHPNTFAKTLEFIQNLVMGKWPIPRQYGGESGPSHAYSVAEGGKPEIVTAPGVYLPSAPGQVIPLEGRQFGGEVNPTLNLPYRFSPQLPVYPRQGGGDVYPSIPRDPWEEQTERMRRATVPFSGKPTAGSHPLEDPLKMGEWWERSKRSLADPGRWFGEQAGQFTKWPKTGLEESPGLAGEITRGIRGMKWRSPYESPYEPGLPSFQLPSDAGERPPSATIPEGGQAAPYTGPRPWRDKPIDLVKSHGGAYEVPKTGLEAWGITREGLPTGETRYTLPGTEGTMTLPKDWRTPTTEESMEVLRPGLERGQREREAYARGMLPERTYYEAHPEERYMDIATEANRPYTEAFMRQLRDAQNRAAGFGISGGLSRTVAQERAQGAAEASRLAGQLPAMIGAQAKLPAEYYRYGMEYGPEGPMRLKARELEVHERLADIKEKHEHNLAEHWAKTAELGETKPIMNHRGDLIDRTGKILYKAPPELEHMGPIYQALDKAASIEGFFDLDRYITLYNQWLGNQPGFKPKTYADFPKSMLRRSAIQMVQAANPKLKSSDKEFQKEVELILKAMQTGD